MFKNILLIFSLSFLFKSLSYSQNTPLQLTSPITVSPQAAAFAKYGEIPVSLNSGIPNISIPIYKINAGDISFPIELSYHASGIKVEDIATNVGLGWSLSFSGNVTRQVRGMPDESSYGYNNSGGLVEEFLNNQLSNTDRETFLTNYRLGYIDSQKDLYYYSLPGSQSGKFFLDSNDNYVSMPRTNIKIEQVYIESLPCWKITNDQGIQYIFDQREFTYTETYSSVNGGGSINTFNFDGVSGWYLSRIIDARGNKIDFNYTAYESNFTTKASETQKITTSTTCPYLTNCDETSSKVVGYNAISGPKIKSISWKDGKIMFLYTNSKRLDLNTTDTALSEIIILDNKDNLIKKYRFYTSYFGRLENTIPDSTLLYSLRLDSLKEVSSHGRLLPPYIFEYNDNISMPNRLSNSQDYWGFYNGKSNDMFVSYFRTVDGKPVKLGANKEVDTFYTQGSILNKIFYPTGGYTSFEYENNRHYVYKDTFYSYSPIAIADIAGDNSGGGEYQYLFTFDEPFTIQQSDTVFQNKAVLRADILGGCDNPNNWVCNVQIMLYYPDSTHRFLSNGDTLELPPGNYLLHARIETEFAHTPFASAIVGLMPGTLHLPGNYDEYAGGIRIKNIINSDGVKVTGKKEYLYNTFETDYSSGSIGNNNNLPQYFHSEIFNRVIGGIINCFCFSNSFSSTSNYPLLTSGGNYVTYKNVEEIQVNTAGYKNGKTRYYYTAFDDYSDYGGTEFPFPPPTSYEWTRGLLLKQEDFRSGPDTTFTLLKKKINTYHFLGYGGDTTGRFITGFVAAPSQLYESGGLYATSEVLNAALEIGTFRTVSEYYNLQSDTTVEYDPDGSGNNITTINEYNYSKYPFLMNWQKTKTSKGDVIKTNYRYPFDYTAGGFIAPMLEKNMFAVPIEQYTEKITTSNDTTVVSGVITSYKANSLLKDKVFKINTSLPIPRNSFSTSFMNGNDFYPGSNYAPLLLFNKYDTNNNIIEQQKKDDAVMSYIWDYSFNYPVAEVKNADSASIAYTSFEADGKGSWVFSGTPVSSTSAITGKKMYALASGDIIKFSLTTSTTYIVSYWSKSGAQSVNGSTTSTSGRTVNGWTYYEHKVIPAYATVTVSGSDTIDELRLYPKGSLMTTYTYDRLIGGTSVCDANNRITYYKYDDFGRLVLIVDQDNNVLKKICYNYQGQSENCITCTNYAPVWQNTATALGCQLDSCGRTGYKVQEQLDTNPCSPTYNQTQWVAAGYDTTACSLQSCIALSSYNNTGDQDFVASYYNTSTHVTYAFTVPIASGQQPLGNLAAGTYNLTISRRNSDTDGIFDAGCGSAISGSTPAVFYNINVSPTNCTAISIYPPYE